MSLWFAAYVAVPALTVFITAVLAYSVYTQHGSVRGSRWFVLHLGLVAAWNGSVLVSLLFPDEFVRIVAYTMNVKFGTWTLVAWVFFAGKYSETDFHEHWLVRGLVGISLLLTLTPSFAEPFRSLFYVDLFYTTTPFPHVVGEPAGGFLVGVLLVTVLTGYGLYVLVRYMRSMSLRSGVQIVLLVFGSLSVGVAIFLELAGAFPVTTMSHEVYGTLPLVLFTTLALFRFRLFDVRPVARNALVEDLEDPTIILDDSLTVVDFNEASTEVWPDLDESIGETVENACPGLGSELARQDGDIDAPARFTIERNGRRRVFSPTISTARPGHEGGSTLHALLLRDVTDLEQSRSQLEGQNERLEQVAATISHDLRNPINVAQGYADILSDVVATDDVDPDEWQQGREYLRNIGDAHDRMEDIIDDVLTLAREGRTVVETEPISLADAARTAWETVATADATLVVEGDYRLDGDESKLLTLLENLYRNAVEHAGADVAVTVGSRDGGFYVADDGPGIPADDADEVFEYGYSTADGGTGLGLSIVRTIAESHGWSVELDRDAEGTRFVFEDVTAHRGQPNAGGYGPDTPTDD